MKKKKYFEGADIIRDGEIMKDDEMESPKSSKESELEIEMMIDMGKLKSGKVPPRNKKPVKEEIELDIVPKQEPLKKFEDAMMEPKDKADLESKKIKYKMMLEKLNKKRTA